MTGYSVLHSEGQESSLSTVDDTPATSIVSSDQEECRRPEALPYNLYVATALLTSVALSYTQYVS